MLSTLSNNVGMFLEPVKTWRMKPLPMWQSKDDFVLFQGLSKRISLDAAQTRMTPTRIINKYHTLHQASELLNHTSDKIEDVIEGSTARVNR